MPAGRPAYPDAIKKRTGTFRAHRAQADIPLDKLETTPPAPETLDEIGAAEWNRLCPILIEMKIFTTADLNTLEAYCDAYAAWKEADAHLKQEGKVYESEKGHKLQNPWWWVRNKALDQMRAYGTELGFSPIARARLKRPNGPQKNEYESFRLRATAS